MSILTKSDYKLIDKLSNFHNKDMIVKAVIRLRQGIIDGKQA